MGAHPKTIQYPEEGFVQGAAKPLPCTKICPYLIYVGITGCGEAAALSSLALAADQRVPGNRSVPEHVAFA